MRHDERHVVDDMFVEPLLDPLNGGGHARAARLDTVERQITGPANQ